MGGRAEEGLDGQLVGASVGQQEVNGDESSAPWSQVTVKGKSQGMRTQGVAGDQVRPGLG